MRREKRSAFLRRVLLEACVFALCIGSVPAGAQQPVSLIFGILPVVDTLPLIVAKEKGFFEAEGIDLKLVSFQSALERDVAFQSNKVNGYFGDLLNTLLLVNAGERLNIITTVFRTNREHRMFALLANPKSGITGMEKVEGETIAISKSSVIEFVLDEILTAKKLRPERVTKLEIRAIPIRYQMLMGNQVKMALLPEPLVTKAVAEGALVLADDRQLDVTLTVLALKQEAVQKTKDLPARFLRAYRKAVQLINGNPEGFKDLLVEKTQFPASVRNVYQVPRFPLAEPPSEQDVRRVERWLTRYGLITKPVAYDALIAR